MTWIQEGSQFVFQSIWAFAFQWLAKARSMIGLNLWSWRDQYTKRFESASPSTLTKRNTQGSARTGSAFCKHSESEFAKFRWRLPIQANLFHREQRTKNWKQKMLFTDLKVPHEDGRHLLEYVLGKPRTCRHERRPDRIGSSLMSTRDKSGQNCVYFWRQIWYLVFK